MSLRNRDILTRLFPYVHEPYVFARLSKMTRSIATMAKNQVAWISKHLESLESWTVKYTLDLVHPSTAIEWMLIIQPTPGPKSSLVYFLSRPEVLVSLSRLFFVKPWVLDDRIYILQKALWVFGARSSNMDVIRTGFDSPRALGVLKVSLVYKDVACALIHSGEERDVTLLDTLLACQPNLKTELPDLTSVACRLGKLGMLKSLVSKGGYKLNHLLIDLLNQAKDQQKAPILTYLIEYASASDDGKQAVRSWEGISVCAIAFDKGDTEAVHKVIEKLAAEKPNEYFKAQWKAMFVLASTKGNMSTFLKLLSFLENPRFVNAKLAITHRMFVTALGSASDDILAELIDCFVLGQLSEAEKVIFSGLPFDRLQKYEALLLRFCQTSDHDLFLSMFPTFPVKTLPVWLETIDVHRVEMIGYLLRSCQTITDGAYVVKDECLWAAFRTGNIAAAEVLALAGAQVGWMEETSGERDSKDEALNEANEKTTSNLPSAALAFIRGYGGIVDSISENEPAEEAEADRRKQLGTYFSTFMLNAEPDLNHESPFDNAVSRTNSPILHGRSFHRPSKFFAKAPISILTTESDDSLWTALLNAKEKDINAVMTNRQADSLDWMEPSRHTQDLPLYLQATIKTPDRPYSTEATTAELIDAMAVFSGLGGSDYV